MGHCYSSSYDIVGCLIIYVSKHLIEIRKFIFISTGKHIPGCNCRRSVGDICVLHIW